MTQRYLVIALLALLSACSDKTPGSLAPPEWPDLSRFDASVAETLAAARQRFEDANVSGAAATAADWGELGKVYQAHHLYPLAEQCYRNALTLSPDASPWRYYLAYVLQESGRFDAAMEEYAAFIKTRPEYLPARLRLAETRFAAGQMEAAHLAWQATLEKQPGNAAALAGLGRVALSEGRYEEAAEYIEQALQRQPSATRLYHPLAMALRGKGDAQAAALALERRGERKESFSDPLMEEVSGLSRSAQYYLVPALKAAAAGRHTEAAGLFRRVLEIDPDDAAAHAALARVLESLGDLDASLRETQIALNLDPTLTVALYQKGVLHERQGDDEAAIAAYTEVLALEPDYAEPRFLMANALMRTASFQRAASQYEALLAHMPGNVQVLYQLGLANLASGNCKAAMAALESASSINASFGPVVEALVRTFASCPDATDAQRKQSLPDGRWLFEQLPSPAFAEALAMAMAANEMWEDAVNLQSQLVRQGDSEEPVQAFREANLARYRKKLPSPLAWPPSAKVFRPPAVSASQRGGVNPGDAG